MDLILFFVFLLTDLIIVAAFTFVYAGKEQYQDGMLLGVHIPEDAVTQEEVQNITIPYKRNLKRFNRWNFLIGLAVCFLCFYRMSVFLLVWMVWMVFYLFAGIGMIYRAHYRVYQLKVKNQWILPGKTHIVHIDTVVSAMTKKLPVSHWWNLPVPIAIGSSFLLPAVRAFFGTDPTSWLFPVTILLTSFLFWGLHLWFASRRNTVYSEDSSINLSMNRMEKRIWSMLFLSINYLNLIGWGYLLFKLQTLQWLYTMDYFIYIGLQLIPVIVLLAGFVFMQRRKKEVLSMDPSPVTVDDDEYWKYGWYSNPNDSSSFVQDRFCSMNYSMNMAKTGVKVFSAVTAAVIAALLIFSIVLILQFENVSITCSIDDGQMTVRAALYHSDIQLEDIQDVELLSQMPEDDFTRTNGGATGEYLVGHFRGKTTGSCMLYLYQNDTSVLKIRTPDEIIFINSKDETDVRQWYQQLMLYNASSQSTNGN